MPELKDDSPQSLSPELQNHCFTYSLDQISKYGLNPAIIWRWTVSERYFFFNLNDVANTIWINHHSSLDERQNLSISARKCAWSSLNKILLQYPEHVHRFDDFINAKGYIKAYRVLTWSDFCHVCGLIEPVGMSACHDLTWSKTFQRCPSTPSKIIRRALGQEILSGRLYQEAQRQQRAILAKWS